MHLLSGLSKGAGLSKHLGSYQMLVANQIWQHKQLYSSSLHLKTYQPIECHLSPADSAWWRRKCRTESGAALRPAVAWLSKLNCWTKWSSDSLTSHSYSRSSSFLFSTIKCPPDRRRPKCPMLVISPALSKLEDKCGFGPHWENSEVFPTSRTHL